MRGKVWFSLVLMVCAGSMACTAWGAESVSAEAPKADKTKAGIKESTEKPRATTPTELRQPRPLPATPAAKPAKSTGAARAAKPKAETTKRTEVELSGVTSETSDQLHGRVNLTRLDGEYQWWLRTGYGITKTRTYTTKSVNETDLDTFTLDAQYRRDHGRGYRFVSAAANVRRRSPHSSVYFDKSGYYMVLGGVGRSVTPALEAELALAKITRYEEQVDNRITPVYSLRLRTDLTNAVVLDGDSHFVQPFSNDPLVDARVNLTYKLTPAVSLRLTYVANNMLRHQLTRTGWDKSFRVSLVFSRSGS